MACTTDDPLVIAAIAMHGPIKVRAAAHAQMGGDMRAMPRVGLGGYGLADLWRISNTCYERMDEPARERDYRETQIALAAAIGADKDLIQMPLDRDNTNPLYLLGRLTALAEVDGDRVPVSVSDKILASPGIGLGLLFARIKPMIRAGKLPDAWAQEIIAKLPPSLPKTPMPIEHHGDYWIGYYQQRGYPRHVAIERSRLARAGEALYGERWQSDLARMLGWDSARVRQIMAGARPLPGGAAAEIVAALRTRSAEAALMADELERSLSEPRVDDAHG